MLAQYYGFGSGAKNGDVWFCGGRVHVVKAPSPGAITGLYGSRSGERAEPSADLCFNDIVISPETHLWPRSLRARLVFN